MRFFETIAVAFSMFSAIPMPQFAWSEDNMRYALCAFPLVGAVVGAALTLWSWAAPALELGAFATGAGYALLPLLITGGIHLDGFCDTVDALASHQSREKMLEIMKDPHAGAFAIMGAVAYLLATAALGSEVRMSSPLLGCLALLPVLSRTLSALAIASFPCAKNTGLAHAFATAMIRKRARIALLCELIAICALMAALSGPWALCVILPAGAVFGLYARMSIRKFGGITGDLAGWFLQTAELAGYFGLFIAGRLL